MPSFISGTSSEFLGRKPLPRAVRLRPLVFVLGPSGVGKSAVARRLLGEDALYLEESAFIEAINRRARNRRWEQDLLEAPALIVDGPPFLARRLGVARSFEGLLRSRVDAGLRTIVTEASDAIPTTVINAVPTDQRATVLLRFPVGRGRRRYAARVCEELGVDPRFARRMVDLEPWTYDRVRSVVLALRHEDTDSIL